MTYIKTLWIDNAAPDIDAAHLNKIEQGIFDAHTASAAASTNADQARSDASSAVSTVNGHVASQSNPHLTTAKQVGARHNKNAVKLGAVADGSTDNTAVLQGILEGFRAARGKNELYLPGEAGAVYCTKALSVPSGTRIVSDGATLKHVGFPAWAGGSPGLLNFERRVDLGESAQPTYLRVEGLVLQGGFNGTVGNSYGILISGNDVIVSDVKTVAPGDVSSFFECLSVDAGGSFASCQGVIVENCDFWGGRRDGISIIGGDDVTIRSCHIWGVTAVRGDAYDLSPGAGIQVEPDRQTQMSSRLWLIDNSIHDCAGAGIGFDIDPPGAVTRVDNGTARDIFIRGNAIRTTAKLPFGGTPDAAAATTGGFFGVGGEVGGGGYIIFQGNTIQEVVRGYDVDWSSTNQRIVAVGNRLSANANGQFNPGGTYTASANY